MIVYIYRSLTKTRDACLSSAAQNFWILCATHSRSSGVESVKETSNRAQVGFLPKWPNVRLKLKGPETQINRAGTKKTCPDRSSRARASFARADRSSQLLFSNDAVTLSLTCRNSHCPLVPWLTTRSSTLRHKSVASIRCALSKTTDTRLTVIPLGKADFASASAFFWVCGTS